MIPFYIYYSMFGFQRIGDLAWAAGDMRTRGFLIGGTSGRTTLNGEGLQHEDGHSHVLASTIPNCVGYDPTYAYELAVIIQNGLKRMYVDNEDVYFYITTLNENYPHPAMPEGAEEGILKGMYKLKTVEGGKPALKTRLLGSGAILREVEAGAELLAKDFGVTSRNLERDELHRTAPRRARGRALEHAASGGGAKRSPMSSSVSARAQGPVIAATDYIKAIRDGIRPYRAGALQGARHRRLRPLRLSPPLALVLRGRSLSRRGRRAEGARRRSVAAGQDASARRSALRHRPREAEPDPKSDRPIKPFRINVRAKEKRPCRRSK